jgi:hypothetical protein
MKQNLFLSWLTRTIQTDRDVEGRENCRVSHTAHRCVEIGKKSCVLRYGRVWSFPALLPNSTSSRHDKVKIEVPTLLLLLLLLFCVTLAYYGSQHPTCREAACPPLISHTK